MNRKIVQWISLAVAAGCVAVTVSQILAFRTRKIAAETEQLQAEKARAIAEEQAAEQKRLMRERELATAKQRAENLEAETLLKEKSIAEEDAKAEAENAKRRRVEEENKVAQANLKTAEENRRAKEAEKAALELAIDLAGATNESMRVQLELSESQRQVAERNAEAKAAELKKEELLKEEYDRLIAEQKELNAVLREREEDTRPDRTMAMLIAENEEQRRLELGEDYVPDYEYTEQPTYELHEGPATGFKKPTAQDFRLAAINQRKDKEVDARVELSHKRIVREMEALVRQALRDGRKEDAEFYYASLISLVPEYTPAASK